MSCVCLTDQRLYNPETGLGALDLLGWGRKRKQAA
jgi:hypothetical protein